MSQWKIAERRLAQQLDALVQRQDLDQRPDPARIDRQRIERRREQEHRQHHELDQLEVREVAQVRRDRQAGGPERVADQQRAWDRERDARARRSGPSTSITTTKPIEANTPLRHGAGHLAERDVSDRERRRHDRVIGRARS